MLKKIEICKPKFHHTIPPFFPCLRVVISGFYVLFPGSMFNHIPVCKVATLLNKVTDFARRMSAGIPRHVTNKELLFQLLQSVDNLRYIEL